MVRETVETIGAGVTADEATAGTMVDATAADSEGIGMLIGTGGTIGIEDGIVDTEGTGMRIEDGIGTATGAATERGGTETETATDDQHDATMQTAEIEETATATVSPTTVTQTVAASAKTKTRTVKAIRNPRHHRLRPLRPANT